jgi:hypothetical protein
MQFKEQVVNGEFAQSENCEAQNVSDFFDANEELCEQKWEDKLESLSLENVVSINDIINSHVDIDFLLEEECLLSFINGQFKQFNEQLSKLNRADFLEFLRMSNYETKVLRYLAK